jgi:Lar family restriction alleviation protein
MKGFIQFSKAWYNHIHSGADSRFIDDITIGFYVEEEPGEFGTTGEFTLEWKQNTSNEDKPFVILKVHNDSWKTLSEMPEVLMMLSALNDTHPTSDEIAKMLIELGFTDMTPTKGPDRPLRECPFCGSKEVEAIIDPKYNHEDMWAVICKECPAQMSNAGINKELAIKAWNTRG